jgi:hypothetical protein
MSPSRKTFALRVMIGLVLTSLAISCKQYEYASPGPGILEIRLKVINSPDSLGGHRDVIPFGPNNVFRMMLKELRAIQPGNLRMTIYSDLYAKSRRDPGDFYNVMSPLAETGDIILGQAYAPPQTFTGLDMQVYFYDSFVQIFGGERTGTILLPVVAPPPPAPSITTFYEAPPSPRTYNITINEGRKTVVYVTFDLDTAFLRRSESFEFYPAFDISSVINY